MPAQLRQKLTLVLATAAMLGISACGSDGSGGAGNSSKLPAADTKTVTAALDAFQAACIPTAAAELRAAYQSLIALYRRNPDAVYQPRPGAKTMTMEEILKSSSRELSGCKPDYSVGLTKILNGWDGQNH